MISKLLSRTLACVTRSSLSLPTLSFSFTRVAKKHNSRLLLKNIEEQLAEEQKELIDHQEFIQFVQNEGWKLSLPEKTSALVEMSKDIKHWKVFILSNVKSPTNFDEADKNESAQEQQQEQAGDVNQITIFVQKNDSQKTMVVSTLLGQDYEVKGVYFADNLAQARAGLNNYFDLDRYSGPELDTLSGELNENIYEFIEDELGIQYELLLKLGNFCFSFEQSFYINWLKDFKSFL